MAASQTFSGARSIFFLGQTPVAFAGGVSGGESVDYEPVDVLNLLEKREFVPVAYQATLSAQVFRQVGNSLKKQGFMPKEQDIITADDLSCSIKDSVSRTTIALFQNVRCSSYNFNITARGIVAQDLQFVAIRMRDEFDSV